MTVEEKIFEISKRIGYKVGTYCNDEEVEVFEKLLKDYKYKNNLVEKQQTEIEKKDKIIDEMADYMLTEFNDKSFEKICKNFSCTYKWKDNRPTKARDCKGCIKEYFKKKVEDK